jgi:hypothetical protein
MSVELRRTPSPASSRRTPRQSVLRFLLSFSALVLGALIGVTYAFGWLGWSAFWIAYVLVAAAALGLFVFYILYSRKVQTAPRQSEGRLIYYSQADLLDQVNELGILVDPIQAYFLYELLVEPQTRIERVTESVEPLARSMAVKSTFTIALPSWLTSGKIVVPLLIQQKGRLEHGLRFFGPSGERISSLGQQATAAYLAAVMRSLIWYAGGEAALEPYRNQIEPSVLELVSAPIIADRRITTKLAGNIEGLPHDPDFAFLLLLVNKVLYRAAAESAICVVIDYGGTASEATDRPEFRFDVVEESPIDNDGSDESAGDLRSEAQEPFGDQTTVGDYLRLTVERRALASRTHGGRKLPTSLSPVVLVREFVARMLGVSSTVYYMPLENADRGASYHAEFRGPEGTYLADQNVLEYPNGQPATEPALKFSTQPRMGQRHSHLYIREGVGYVSRFYFLNFYERMPGSMAPATLSALAATVLIWLALLKSHGTGIPVHDSSGTSDLIVVLFSFPPIIAVWAGLDGRGGLRGGVVLARIATGITILLSICAALLYLLQAHTLAWWPAMTGKAQWALVAWASALIFVICAGSWTLRALVHTRFLGR